MIIKCFFVLDQLTDVPFFAKGSMNNKYCGLKLLIIPNNKVTLTCS